jgi:enoyl-[acyl-carrier protein] reductase II
MAGADTCVRVPRMRTRLTELLGIEHPVMLAGMGGVSYAALAAAVSEAGGFGCLGASTMDNQAMATEIAAVRQATHKPFGVDLLTAMPGGMTEQVKLIVDGGASAFVAGLGVPTEVIDLCHEHGLLVVSMCGKVDHAVRAVEAGCDLVVAQGTEAGGHTGTVASLPLVPQVVDAVGGLAAALALGADGIWVGTRFIATPEARGVSGYKDRLLGAREDQTTVSRAYSGKTMRVVRNNYTDYYDAHPDELKKFPEQLGAAFQSGAMHLGGDASTAGVDVERECYPAGQGVGAITELVPAAELVRRFVAEAETALDQLAAYR